MKKTILLVSVLSLIQIALLIAIKGFSYPLLLLFIMLSIFTYISIEDWKTGFISIPLNISTLLLSGAYAFFIGMDIKEIGFNLLIFVLPFILLEGGFQLLINRGRDEERFLIGGGDIMLFATLSMILNIYEMMIMLFIACLLSLIVSKIIKKQMVHFAPFVQIGFLLAFLFSDIYLM